MITAHHIAASTQCHEFYSAGYLGSRPLTSSIGYPKALAERTLGFAAEVSSRQNNPRPILDSVRTPLHQYICGIERQYAGTGGYCKELVMNLRCLRRLSSHALLDSFLSFLQLRVIEGMLF